ncbi:MAG: hypothetical protein ACE5G0_13105 [Rhodothermales bacterium]
MNQHNTVEQGALITGLTCAFNGITTNRSVRRKSAILSIVVVSIVFMGWSAPASAQSPSDPVWGLYASGVGNLITAPAIDPCDITYTIAWTGNTRIANNLAMGTMVTIYSEITWMEAQAGMKLHGKYFDDEPDGIVKLSSCFEDDEDDEDDDFGGGGGSLCSFSGTWDSSWGTMTLTQDGASVTGTYTHDEGRIEGTIINGVLIGTWTEAPSRTPPNDAGDVELTLSADCMEFSGSWRYGSTGTWNGGWTGTRQ